MDENLRFRNVLASKKGIELTPKQAGSVRKQLMNMRRVIRRTMEQDPTYYERLMSETGQERLEAIQTLNQQGYETTPTEYDALKDIILTMYRQEYGDDGQDR